MPFTWMGEKMIGLDVLCRVPLFKGLSDEQLSELLPLLKPLQVAKGEYVIREGSFGDQIFLLFEGCVQVTKDLVKGFDEDQSSTEKVLASLCGDYLPTFGENGVLGHAARTANIIATKECLLYTLSKTDFESFATADNTAGFVIMTNIAKKLSESLSTTDANLVKLATALYIAVRQ